MSDEDSSLAETLGYAEKLLLDFISSHRVERAEGLIEQQDRRIGSQRARNADSLPLSAGKLSRVAVHILLGWKIQHAKQFTGAALDPLRLPAFQARHQPDVSRHREVRKQSD